MLQRPTTKVVPIERTGSPMCPRGLHLHCSRCGTCDVPPGTVYAPPTRDGGRFAPQCRECSVKTMRVRSVERAVLALEVACD